MVIGPRRPGSDVVRDARVAVRAAVQAGVVHADVSAADASTAISLAGVLSRVDRVTEQLFEQHVIEDWQYVCEQTAGALREFGLTTTPQWIDGIHGLTKPIKADQDGDAADRSRLGALGDHADSSLT